MGPFKPQTWLTSAWFQALSDVMDNRLEEMKARGMKPDDTRVFKREQWPNELYNDWIPTIEDQQIIRQRIEEKIAEKPDWYRKSH